ncbi:MAG: dienelactone hydrolase family protein [Massilia sp.]
MSKEWIQLDAADGKFDAYVVTPHLRRGPGIVLIQEIFGVNEHIRSVAEQYALDGYMVIVPDLFWRAQPRIELDYDQAGWKRGFDIYNNFDFAKGQSDIAAAVAALKARPGYEGKIASVGFCLGGLLSYHTIANGLVDAGVCYYGGGIASALDRAADIKVPTLMLFGEADEHIPQPAVEKITAAFQDNPLVQIRNYPDAQHGFNCSYRDSYNMRAAVKAHGETLVFLSEKL